MPKAQINNLEINYVLEGDPSLPVLVLSNSLTTDLHLWDEQITGFPSIFGYLDMIIVATAFPLQLQESAPLKILLVISLHLWTMKV